MTFLMKSEDYFGPRGLLSATLPGYEVREPQLQMVKAIEKAIRENAHLVVEAGTGVGKSLAYLVPFILWAREEKKKVVVATYSKALQYQLMEKDIPFLKRALGLRFHSALCVGGQNYLCLRRLEQVRQHGLYDSREESRQISSILAWQAGTTGGLKSELSFEPLPALWAKVCRESDLCFGKKCPHTMACYYHRARMLQRHAHILIVNHHLFFAHLASGEYVLPPFDAVVFDEAHNLEETAAGYLGLEVASSQIKFLADSLHNPRTKKGLLERFVALAPEEVSEVRMAVDRLRFQNELFFDSVIGIGGGRRFPQRMKTPWGIVNTVRDPLGSLKTALERMKRELDAEEDRLEISAFLGRISALRENLDIIIEQQKEEQVYWVEHQKRTGHSRVSLNMAPLDIAEKLKEAVFEKISPIVMTSATLSTEGHFEYIKGRLGIPGARVQLLGSPFDYRSSTLLYIAADLPDPGKETEIYEQRALERIVELLFINGGRTFVLFTSARFMDRAYEILQGPLRVFSLMKQGEKPHSRLIEDFKSLERAVLFGTNSFWQGIDIPGRALESVIITKLPFAVPDDPLTEARIEQMKSREIDPFANFQLPQAIIWLKQGFGRLIRSREDRGMVALLDSRIRKRSYGRKFISSLPPCRETTSLDEVEAFFRTFQ